MKKDLEKNQLDRVRGKLLRAAIVPEEQIEKAIGAPGLFAAIKAGINAEKAQREESRPVGFAEWNWLRFAVQAMALVIIALGAFGLFKYSSKDYSIPEVAQENNPAPPVDLPQPPESAQDGVELIKVQEPQRTNIASARRVHTEVKRAVRTRSAKTPMQREVEEVGEFYALSYAGSLDTARESGQIIRVELPRSSLFALGIDVPVENARENRVKADLLIGEDGMTKAVRIVN